ncbi:MAG: type II secretion system protein [Verrucomicrobiota bacterium]|nr:type II secretion system protein [Verrucomicrobiota bacterium]
MNKTLRNIKGGFTLIELLVVIAIIAILASLAVPAVMKAKVKANVTKSASNMKQVVLACKLYAADFNDSYPSTGASPTLSVNHFNLLIPTYAGGVSVFQVPGYGTTFTNSTLQAADKTYNYVYGLTDTSDAGNIVVTEAFNTDPTSYTAALLIAGYEVNTGVLGGTGVNVAKVDGSVIFTPKNTANNVIFQTNFTVVTATWATGR